jgi:hypothetical protein
MLTRFAAVAVLVLGFAVATFAQWYPPVMEWNDHGDAVLEQPLPCGSAGNTHTASLSVSHNGQQEIARVYFLCHDGGQHVRTYPLSVTAQAVEEPVAVPEHVAVPMPTVVCQPGTVLNERGACLPRK